MSAEPNAEETVGGIGGRRWLMLALGVAAQTVACVFVYGVPYLVPSLRSVEHLSLGQAGTVIAAPTLGLVVALIAWGAAADRYGERLVISSGLAVSALVLFLGLLVHGSVLLWVVFFLAGAAGAAVYAASGRVVMGWFTARERGLAMGVRQTSTPLGMGIAAVTVPPLATAYGFRGPLLLAGGLTGVIALAVALFVVDPPRSAVAANRGTAARPSNPYRGPALWRIHGASALLVWPQFTISAFGLVFLTDVQHLSVAVAGQLMAAGQLLGALGRVLVGKWSDKVGSRLRPMRQLAMVNVLLMALLALCSWWSGPFSVPLVIVTCGLAASTNGLSFTSTAELAGPAWSGRALGVQNTGQNLTASLTPPLTGELIGSAGYGAAFLLAGACALGAAFVTPTDRLLAKVKARRSVDAPAVASG